MKSFTIQSRWLGVSHNTFDVGYWKLITEALAALGHTDHSKVGDAEIRAAVAHIQANAQKLLQEARDLRDQASALITAAREIEAKIPVADGLRPKDHRNY